MVRVVDKDKKALIKKRGTRIMKESSAKNQNLSKINDFRIAFIRCDCDSEILVVRYDAEVDMLDLGIYETRSSFANTTTFWQKLKYIYYFLKKGFVHTDQIVLNRFQIEELKGFLNNV